MGTPSETESVGIPSELGCQAETFLKIRVKPQVVEGYVPGNDTLSAMATRIVITGEKISTGVSVTCEHCGIQEEFTPDPDSDPNDNKTIISAEALLKRRCRVLKSGDRVFQGPIQPLQVPIE